MGDVFFLFSQYVEINNNPHDTHFLIRDAQTVQQIERKRRISLRQQRYLK